MKRVLKLDRIKDPDGDSVSQSTGKRVTCLSPDFPLSSLTTALYPCSSSACGHIDPAAPETEGLLPTAAHSLFLDHERGQQF